MRLSISANAVRHGLRISWQQRRPCLRFTRHHYKMAPRRLDGPTHLIFDFDGTLTVNDTMVVLGRLPKNPPISWDEIAAAYMKDHQAFKETPYPWKNYDEEEYSGWLASRKWLEQRSAQRVQDSGFFRGVTLEDVSRVVATALDDGSLQFRQGWLDLFELVMPTDTYTAHASKISIISVNWSETFIRCALLEAARRSDHEYKEAICQYINHMKIHANEIHGLNRPEGSSGVVCRESGFDIRTSDDKLRYMPNVSPDPTDGSHPLVAYLGDSSTDFDCLLEAHLGVWIYSGSAEQYRQAFKETFKPFEGFVPQPLSDGEVLTDAICWSPDFENVLKTLMRHG